MSKKTKDIFVNKYWQDRMAQSQVKLANKTINETEKQIKKYYVKAAEHCVESFEATYDKLYTAIEHGREPTPADLYKLDKYWQSQAQIRKELQRLGEKEVAYMTKAFEDVWIQVYNSFAIPSDTAFSTVSTETINQLINQVWCADGKNWSSRIWSNTEELAAKLNEELVSIVATGKRTTDLKNTLMECFDVSYRQANMLVRTEVAHIQTQAAKQRYLDSGVSEVEVWADYDERRCDICGKLHQKKIPINEALPIPAHPNCRCVVLPVITEKVTATLTNENKNDIIYIGRSVGASAKNYPVKAPDSKQHYRFAEGTSITKIKVIMGKGTNIELKEKCKIAIRNRINNPDDIQKLRGEGFVIANGKKRKAELHWYQANGENYEFKIKRYFDES